MQGQLQQSQLFSLDAACPLRLPDPSGCNATLTVHAVYGASPSQVALSWRAASAPVELGETSGVVKGFKTGKTESGGLRLLLNAATGVSVQLLEYVLRKETGEL